MFRLQQPGLEPWHKAKSLLEAKPLHIESVLIALTDEQVACATSAGLLQSARDNYGHVLTAASDQGRKLGVNGFLVSKGEVIYLETDEKEFAGKRQIQLNGTFALAVDEVTGITDLNTTQGIKIAEVEVRVKLPNACFAKPLKAVGGPHNSALHFRFRRYDDGWRLDQQVP